MKAIQIQQFGSPDVLQLVDLDIPAPAPGEVLIKVTAASVNYSDIARRANASYPYPTPLPFIPGGEVAGTVADLGEGVDGPPVDTPVFALVGNGAAGYAQYATTPAAQVIPIPDGVSPEVAAALPIAGTTAMLILREEAALQPGETVLVQGAAGGVGSYLLQIARHLGAGTVIGATSSPAKFDKILANGADHAVTYDEAADPEVIRKLTDGRGVDVLLEMGSGARFGGMARSLAPFGRVIVYGKAGEQAIALDEATITHMMYDPSLNQSIRVFNLGLWFGMRPAAAGAALSDLVGLVASGEIEVAVDHMLPLAHAAEAHRMIEARETTGKVVLQPWAEA